MHSPLPRASAMIVSLGLLLALLAAAPASAFTWYSKLCVGFASCDAQSLGNDGYENSYTTSYWGMYAGHNCTNYAAYRLIQARVDASWLRGHGNAYEWRDQAVAHNVSVDMNPSVGDIAWWSSSSGIGSDGHVAYVERVNGDGTVTVSEDNYGGDFDWRNYRTSEVSGFIHFGGSQPPVGPTSNGGESIFNTISERCVDVSGGSSDSGTGVQLYDCNGTPGQRWKLVGKTLRVYGSPEKCLDVKGGALVAGTAIQIWDCTDNNLAQQWSVESDGTIRSANGLCLDAYNAGTSNGTRLQLWTCNAGNPAQAWAGPAYDNGGTTIENPYAGRCVEVGGGTSALRATIQLYDCNDTAAQHWIREGATLRVYGNECLDVTNAVMAKGQPVQLWQCTSDNNAQKWSVRSDGTIRTINGLCLDALNAGTTNGTRLQIMTCNGSTAQQWVGPNVSNSGGKILGTASGRCIDISGGAALLGTTVQLFDCNGSTAQQWKYTGGALRAYANACLDVTGGHQDDGTRVQLWTCNGGAAQHWDVRDDGTIRTPGGKCLDSTNAGTANNTSLLIWTCNGSATQQWSATPRSAAVPKVVVRARTLTISWPAATSKGSVVTAYQVLVGKATKSLTTRRLVLKSVKPGRYSIRLRAVNAVGAGGYSKTRSVVVK